MAARGILPPAVSRGAALAVALLLLVAGCAHLPSPAGPPGDSALDQVIPLDDPDRGLLATAIIAETNRARAANRGPALERDFALDAAADEQAVHMAMMLRSEHSNPIPGEGTAAERVLRAGYRASRVAENAIMLPSRPPSGSPQGPYTYSGLAAELVRAWMESPGHRLNLLDPASLHIGCAARFAKGGLGTPLVFAVQVFAVPASAN